MSDVDIRFRPNAARTVGKAILRGLADLIETGVQAGSYVCSNGNIIHSLN